MKASKRAFDPDNGVEGGFLTEILRYARRLQYGEVPDYDRLVGQLAKWGQVSLQTEALDWTPISSPVPVPIADVHGEDSAADDADDGIGDDEEPNEEYSNSYFGYDIDCWDDYAARDRDVTLPAEQAEMLDGLIPVIERVVEE